MAPPTAIAVDPLSQVGGPGSSRRGSTDMIGAVPAGARRSTTESAKKA